MAFRQEPPFTHGTAARTGILLVNLGSPDEPTPAATRRYLAEFLSDRRVVEIPRFVWWLILHGIVLRTRPSQSAAKYATIWTPQGSPLVAGTAALAEKMGARFQAEHGCVLVRHAMRYGNPSIASALDALRADGATRILVLPLYPQYAAATTGSAWDAVAQWARSARHVPEFRFVNRYGDDPDYIQALARSVQAHWATHGRSQLLVMTFHGLPERSLTLGDPYHCECQKTARLLGEALGLPKTAYRVTFQSRFGRAQWLRPYTEPTLKELASNGLESVDVVCPGFAIDCLETLEEIAQEAREAFLEAGGKTFHYIPCLNDSDDAATALIALSRTHMNGWPLSPPLDATALQAQRTAALALGSPD